MPSERDFLPIGQMTDYAIAGNVFRAYYDAQGNLAFVIDDTQDPRKPNTLLVLDAVGDRKWDDILANDMGVDLETVRPKKDNKYQKLDIEYSGLPVYVALIAAYEADEDITDALVELELFRDTAARHAAGQRLAVAEDVAEKSRDTIETTAETIVELQERVRELRRKLADLRKSIGREPTKQSAAKILRCEARIDATNEKLSRAKKRLSNAQKRLDDADADADVARAILARLDAEKVVPENYAVSMPVATDMMVAESALPPAEVAADQLPDIVHAHNTDLTIINDEQGALTMADENEEVKPLFDTDPEILDDEIAFKPIEFGAPMAVAPVPAPTEEMEKEEVKFEPIPAPLSFAPPVAADVVEEVTERPIDVRPVVTETQPVLQSMTPIAEENTEIFETVAQAAPVAAPVEFTPVTRAAQEVPDVAPAPIDSSFRPVSPITGAPVAAAGGKDVAAGRAQKPTVLYYVMLVALIVLSIFTLWMYQRNSADTMPNLSAKTAEEVVAPVVEVQEVEPVPEPEPVVIPEPEPIVIEPEPVPVVVPEVEVEPVPVVVETPEIAPEPVEVKVGPAPAPVEEPASPFIDEAAIIASKPAYNVSQNENMFVAADDYDDGETVAVKYEDVESILPVVEYKEPAVVTAPAPVSVVAPVYSAPTVAAPVDTSSEFVLQSATSQVYPADADEVVETCADGNTPDINGCCSGEVFTDMEDGTFACCTPDGLDCFPPM